MAHFRGTLKGNRGEASRLGTPRSGLTVRANGWDFGVSVYLSTGPNGDTAQIYLTSGSNGFGPNVNLGSFTAADLKTRKAS